MNIRRRRSKRDKDFLIFYKRAQCSLRGMSVQFHPAITDVTGPTNLAYRRQISGIAIIRRKMK